MRQEPVTIINELVASLPDATRAKVQGIPLQVIEDPKDVNAFAGCGKSGAAFMGITMPLVLILARTSEARAYDELFGTAGFSATPLMSPPVTRKERGTCKGAGCAREAPANHQGAGVAFGVCRDYRRGHRSPALPTSDR